MNRPVAGLSTSENPQLAGLKKEFYVYTMPYVYRAVMGDHIFTASFQVEQSNDYWISNFGAIGFFFAGGLPFLGNTIGRFSLRDNSTLFSPIQDVPLAAIANSYRPNYRTILPLPYGIGAGGSFTCTIVIDAGVGGGGPVDNNGMVTIEGWRDFAFGGGKGTS